MSMAMSSGTGLEYVVYVRIALETAIECATQRLTVIDPEQTAKLAAWESLVRPLPPLEDVLGIFANVGFTDVLRKSSSRPGVLRSLKTRN